MKNRNAKVFCLFALITAAASVAARLFITACFTDPDMGVYTRGTSLPKIYEYLLAAMLLATVIWSYFSKKTFYFREYPVPTYFTAFTEAVLGFMMLACAAVLLFITVSFKKSTPYEVLMIIFAVLSGIYYISLLISRKSKQAALAFLSLTPIFWSMTALVEVYRDMSVLISSPNRIFNQLAYLSLMVFLLAESRVLLGYKSTRLYAPAAACAAVLLLTSSVPNLIFRSTLMIGSSDRPIIYVLQFAAGLYAAAKLISFCFLSAPLSNTVKDTSEV